MEWFGRWPLQHGSDGDGSGSRQLIDPRAHHPIRNYLDGHAAFEPEAILAMSDAFEQACIALNIPAGDPHGREVIAMRVIDLARSGVIDTKTLRNRVLFEARSE